MELEDGDEAEEVGAEQQPGRLPGGEDDQRDGDPAASGAHVLDPQRRIDRGQVGAGDAGHGAAEDHRAVADGDHRVADRVGSLRRLADRLEQQAEAGFRQGPGDQREGGQRQVDHPVLLEQHRSEQRDVAEQRHDHRLQPGQAVADVVLADEGRQADAEDGQGEAAGGLVGGQRQGEEAEHGGRRSPGQGAGGQADGGAVAGFGGGGETGDGADQHHAFDAEVDDAAAFGDQFAEAGEDQRRGGGKRAGEDQGEVVEHRGLRSPVSGRGGAGGCR